MNKLNISVKDQFGVHYAIEATLDEVVSSTVKTYERIKYIIVDNEVIRPRACHQLSQMIVEARYSADRKF